MLMLADEISALGHVTTFHYTHPPRSIVMQAILAGRGDYTSRVFFRGIVFFTGYTAGGVDTELSSPPLSNPSQFRADDLTEVRGRILADNCSVRAVINQFLRKAAAPGVDSVDAAATSRVITFHRPENGTIAYKHVVRVYAGGRPVSEQEAIAAARSLAADLQIDVDQLEMRVTTQVDQALRARCVDIETGEYIAVPFEEGPEAS